MKKFVDLLEKNAQWIAIAIAGLWFVLAAISYVLSPSTSVSIDNQDLSPGEVDKHVNDGNRQQLRNAMQAPAPTSIPSTDPSQLLSAGLKVLPLETVAIDRIFGDTPKILDATPTRSPPPPVTVPSAFATLINPAAPIIQITQVTTDRAVYTTPTPPVAPGAPTPAAANSQDVIAIRIPFVLDSVALHSAYLFSKTPDSTPIKFPLVVRVELERMEVGVDKDYSPIVPTYVDPNFFPKIPPDKIPDFLSFANQHQTDITQPAFFQVVHGIGFPPIGPPTPNPLAPPPAPVTPPPGAAPPAPPSIMWVYDSNLVNTLHPGHTYRYRVRVLYANPLYGSKNVALNPPDANVFAIPNNAKDSWSAPSQDVTIPLDQYFFVLGATPTQSGQFTAKVRCWKWLNGGWVHDDKELAPGDTIPQTAFAIADIERAGRDFQVTLVDSNGKIETRNTRQEFAREQNQMNEKPPTPATAAAAAAGPP